MTGIEIVELLRNPKTAAHPGFSWFCEALAGCSYGYEALNDAWDWFRLGWDSNQK